MNDIHDARRIKNINDLHVQSIRVLSAHQELSFFSAKRIPARRMVDDVLGLRRLDAMTANVFDVPCIPAKLVHVELSIDQISESDKRPPVSRGSASTDTSDATMASPRYRAAA